MGLRLSPSQYLRIHSASRADSHDGEVFSLLAGRTSRVLSDLTTSSLYHTLAWRTCCLLILRTSHDVFDFTPLSLQDSGNDLENLYVLPFTFLYQNHLEILHTKKVRVLAIGLEADLIVDTHPLFCFTRGKWSGGQGGRLGLRPLLGGLSAGRRLRPGLGDI